MVVYNRAEFAACMGCRVLVVVKSEFLGIICFIYIPIEKLCGGTLFPQRVAKTRRITTGLR
jgi:hypothetical protein